MANDVRTWRFNYGVDTGTGLLDYEYSGLAVDFTSTTYFNSSTWAMDDVIERNSNTYDLQSPHVFFTQSGTSPKYVKNSSTTIGWSPHNLALQSQVLGTSWTAYQSSVTANSETAPDGTATADTLTGNAANDSHELEQAQSVIVGPIYTVSVYAKSGTNDYIFLGLGTSGTTGASAIFDLTDGSVGDTSANGVTLVGTAVSSAGSGWYRCSVAVISDSTTPTFQMGHANAKTGVSFTGWRGVTWAAANGETVFLWGAQVNRGITPTAYIATTTTAKIGLPISYGEGLLVEPAGTNLITNSQVFGSWNNVNVTQAANDAVAPDGSTTADKITANSGNAVHLSQSPGFTDAGGGQNYTASLYVKSSTAQYVMCAVVISTTTWINSVFDVVGGSVTQTGAGAGGTFVSSSITSIGSGWYRISVTGQMGGGTANVNLHVVDTGTPTVGNFSDYSWNPAGTEAVWLWGGQAETGTVATSYVPTVGSTATRATDNITFLTSSFGFSAATSTVTAWVTPYRTNAGHLFNFSDGTTGERFLAYTTGADLLGFVADGGSGQVNLDTTYNIAANTPFKYSLSIAANDFAQCVDGGSVTTDTSLTLPTVTTVRLMDEETTPGSNVTMGLLRRFIYIPRAAADAELQGFTD
jgi:hypothetical protein